MTTSATADARSGVDRAADAVPAFGRRPIVLPVPWSEDAGRRARYSASRRADLLSCGRHRDPLQHDHRHRQPQQPRTFGLTENELRREANRLHRAGWTVDEVRAVLDLPAPESSA